MNKHGVKRERRLHYKAGICDGITRRIGYRIDVRTPPYAEKEMRVRHDRSRLPLGISGNPLWPLEELHNLRKTRFVAEAEFTALSIDALRSKTESSPASTPGNTQIGTAPLGWHFMRLREFPIPTLVGGMPWRFRDHPGYPLVPEAELNRLDLAALDRP